jgi:BirA family biotin operon repressor/biotin-[acetyl-CoA-carboxylase] ligase
MNIIWLPEVDSTNKYALENFEELDNETLILAESQTSGRGRLGRKWISPPNENVYASFLIKNINFPPYCASWIGSLATLRAMRSEFPELDLWLKWPNDVYCGMKKISGMLCETKTDNSNKICGLVIGIGINLNMPKETLDAIDRPATSVYSETGEKVNCKKFVNSLGIALEQLYSICFSDSPTTLFKDWKEENILLGKTVEVATGSGEIIRGNVEDFGPQGELILRVADKTMTLFSGDISIKSFTGFY